MTTHQQPTFQLYSQWQQDSSSPEPATMAIDMLAAAFIDDPTLRWCFGASPEQYARRQRGYLSVGHQWHAEQGFGLDVLTDSANTLVGASYHMAPEHQPDANAVQQLHRDLSFACDAAPAARFAAYTEACDEVAPPGDYHTLAILAVAPRCQGSGLGGRLLRHLQAAVRTHPSSQGILLDTGNPANVPFYSNHGFEVIAEVRLDGLLETVMFWQVP